MVVENNKDVFTIKEWTPELVFWLRTNTPSCHMLPPEPSEYDLERIRICFDDPVDALAYKLTWS